MQALLNLEFIDPTQLLACITSFNHHDVIQIHAGYKSHHLVFISSPYKFVLVVPFGYYSGDEDGILDMASLIGNIEPFRLSKEDWEQYVERFEQYVVANNVERSASGNLPDYDGS